MSLVRALLCIPSLCTSIFLIENTRPTIGRQEGDSKNSEAPFLGSPITRSVFFSQQMFITLSFWVSLYVEKDISFVSIYPQIGDDEENLTLLIRKNISHQHLRCLLVHDAL